MKNRFFKAMTGLVLLQLAFPVAANATAPEPYPLEYWALREVINNAQVSPDGKHLGLMKIPSKDGNPIIEVYDATDLSKEPFRLNADPMEITQFQWIDDEHIGFILRQKVRDKIEGFNQGVFESRIASVNIKTEKIRTFDEANPAIENILPNKPGKVILSFQEGAEDGPASKLSEAYRPRAYWEYDLHTGAKRLLIRGKIALGNIEFDGEGNPILARGYDRSKDSYVTYYRLPGESGWTELYSRHEDDPQTFSAIGLDEAKPGNFLVYANNGDDKIGLWSFNSSTKKFEELIYRRSDVDVWGIATHSNPWNRPDSVTAVTYFTDKLHREFFDEVEGGMYRQLEELIPYAHILTVNSRSRDGNTMTIYNSGPKDPGTYYLLKDGHIQAVGSKQPLLESEALADLQYITYPSRDGKKIRGYLTVPNGKPPFPLVVLPHGGPFVAEAVSYDELSQLLANRGYLVLQPQYRGSLNYGKNFYHAAFEDNGQIGHSMQDDKDDGAKYLVEQGLADPDRLAMLGFSYGGYASLVAASRTPQIYNCTIAGAIVSDPTVMMNYLRFNRVGDAWEDEVFIRSWDNAVSPVDEVSKVNVPILIIHGDVDQRTPPEQAKRYIKALDEAGKYYKYVELLGADHFFNTWTYQHQEIVYSSIIDFLETDCKSRGLQANSAD